MKRLECHVKAGRCLADTITPTSKPTCLNRSCVRMASDRKVGTAKNLLNPPLLTNFRKHLQDRQECHYHRNRHPLESTRTNIPYAPLPLHKVNRTGGVVTQRGDIRQADQSVWDILTPLLRQDEAVTDTCSRPGMASSRKYDCNFDPHARFGKKSSSIETSSLLQPAQREHPLNEKATKHSITREQTFGVSSNLGASDAADIIYNRVPENSLKFLYPLRAKLASTRAFLMRAVSTNFDNASQAFQFFDKKSLGYIDAESLNKSLVQFNIKLTDGELKALLKDCKGLPKFQNNSFPSASPLCKPTQTSCYSKDCSNTKTHSCTTEVKHNSNSEAVVGMNSLDTINFQEFANFLTFFGHFPLGINSEEGSVSRLSKQVDARMQYQTCYQADFLSFKQQDGMRFGKRSDITVEKEAEGESLSTKQAMQMDAVANIIFPGPFELFNLNKQLNKQPMSKEEIKKIFKYSLRGMSADDFERLHKESLRCGSVCGMSSVKAFRQAIEKHMG